MSFDKTQMASVPAIYEDANNEVYFMTKESSNFKIQKVYFDTKKVLENPCTILYAVKSDNVILFSYH